MKSYTVTGKLTPYTCVNQWNLSCPYNSKMLPVLPTFSSDSSPTVVGEQNATHYLKPGPMEVLKS